MAKMDEKMTCEVVQDLLPLYVDGACTEGSRRLVEEHVKTCGSCKKQLEEMGAPIEGLLAEPEQEKTETERMLAEALKKMRRNYKRVIALCLAVLLAIPVGILLNREKTGKGLALSNFGTWRLTHSLMATWQEEGAAAMAERLEPLTLYQSRAKGQTDIELADTYGLQRYFYGSSASGGQMEKWVEVELLGETYCVSYQESWPNDATEIQDQGSLEINQLYEEGRDLDVLHRIVQENPKEIVLPETAYLALTEAFDDLDTEYYYTLVRDSGVYYYYIDPDYFGASLSQKSREEVLERWMEEYALDYPGDFGEVLDDLKPIDPDYMMLRQHTSTIPKALFEECQDIFREICQNFQDYTRYYMEMGYDAFAENWRQDLTALLTEYPLSLTSYKMDGIESTYNVSGVHLYYTTNGIWETQWDVILDGQPATVVFFVEDDRWCCLEEIRFQGQEVTGKLEEWSEQIRLLSQ